MLKLILPLESLYVVASAILIAIPSPVLMGLASLALNVVAIFLGYQLLTIGIGFSQKHAKIIIAVPVFISLQLFLLATVAYLAYSYAKGGLHILVCFNFLNLLRTNPRVAANYSPSSERNLNIAVREVGSTFKSVDSFASLWWHRKIILILRRQHLNYFMPNRSNLRKRD